MSDKDWRTWAGRGVWAVTDQGLYTIANSLLNILLARWLAPAEYGAFAVAYSIFLLLGALHTAVLTEPALVFGPGKYAECLANYLRLVVRGHWFLTAAGSLLLFAAGLICWLWGSPQLAQALAGLALAAPFSLLTWLVRRAAYARLQPHLAVISSALYFLLTIAGLLVLNVSERVSVFSALVVMGVASAAGGLWLMKRLTSADAAERELPNSREVIRQHWTYGRWAMLTTVLMWVPLNLYFVALSAWVNLEASASLRSMTNLVLPLLQANAALGALLLPALVGRRAERSGFNRLLGRGLALFFSADLLYALLLGASGPWLMRLLYAGKYQGGGAVLWLLLLIPVLDGVAVVLANALRSQERPRHIFSAYLLSAGGVLTAGLLMARLHGEAGAAFGMVLANVIAVVSLAAALWLYLKKNFRETALPPQGRALTVSGL